MKILRVRIQCESNAGGGRRKRRTENAWLTPFAVINLQRGVNVLGGRVQNRENGLIRLFFGKRAIDDNRQNDFV